MRRIVHANSAYTNRSEKTYANIMLIRYITDMEMNDSDILLVYRDLNHVFPEDLHIARPLINMLHDGDHIDAARDLALDTARRMIATGKSSLAIGFLEMCKHLDHPNTEEIDSLHTLAQITADGPVDMESSKGKVFELISQLSDHEAKDFLRQGKLSRFKAGELIVRQGEVSRSFFLLLEGCTHVHIDANGKELLVSKLFPGDFFGEFACVYKMPRTASVGVVEPVLALEFSDASIQKLMELSPIAGERLMKTIQTRLILSASHQHPALVELPEADRKWLAEESQLIELQKGATIAHSDPHDDYAYMLVYGEMEILANPDDEAAPRVTMRFGNMFGNVSNLLRLPKQGKAVALNHCLLCRIPKEVFLSFMNAYGLFDSWVRNYTEEIAEALEQN